MNDIQINQLTVAFGRNVILEKLNLKISAGKITALIGPNGSGKSTLIKALAGVVDYRGEIEFGEKPETKFYEIGYVPQRFEFDFSLPITVEEFMNLSLITCKHQEKEKKGFIEKSLRKTGVLELQKKQLAKLSGGQFQRVLLARAIAHQPKILLLDEPESGIDLEGEREVYSIIKELSAEKGVTVIISTHKVGSLEKYADKVIVLDNSRKGVSIEGEPKTVLGDESLKEIFCFCNIWKS